MTTITIRVIDKDPFADDDDCSATLEGNGTAEHWRSAVRGAMTLAGYQPETIEDVLSPPCFLGMASALSALPTEVPATIRSLDEGQAKALEILLDEVDDTLRRMAQADMPRSALTLAFNRAKEFGL
jgi:hypothetical protein